MALPTVAATGPCGPARLELDTRCSEAERLAQASVAHQQRLREARLEMQRISAQREDDARLRDSRQLSQAKDAARVAYHQQMVTAPDPAAVREAARTWLRELDRLNRQLDTADSRADEINRRSAELAQQLPRLELAADAARIAAAAAHEACVDARRALAACEEAAQRRLVPHTVSAPVGAVTATASHEAGIASRAVVPAGAAVPGVPTTGRAAAASPARRQPHSGSELRAISLVLRGDRDTLHRLALRLAEETGVEPGRLQLLLLELREQVAAQALDNNVLSLPVDHPFWSQIQSEDRPRLVASLAAMGYRFNGVAGWVDDRAPTVRELALAESHTGIDPRTVRRPPDREQIAELWRGTRVMVEEYLAAAAPALELEQVMACLGSRAARLSELWDMWGRLRTMLLAAPSA